MEILIGSQSDKLASEFLKQTNRKPIKTEGNVIQIS